MTPNSVNIIRYLWKKNNIGAACNTGVKPKPPGFMSH
jgi:hypothetical protein